MINDPRERAEGLEHLQCLVQTLSGMSESYVPVERMCRVIDAVIRESGWDETARSSVFENGHGIVAPSPSSRRKASCSDNTKNQLFTASSPPVDSSAFVFDHRYRSENLSNENQRPGCEIESIGSQIGSRPEDATGSVANSFCDPVFFSNGRDTMDTRLDRRDEGFNIWGGTVEGLDLMDLDFGISNGQNFRNSERPGELPDFWGSILRQLGTST
jgi:hypothetical protein